LLFGFAIIGKVSTVDYEDTGSFFDSDSGRTGFSAAGSYEFY